MEPRPRFLIALLAAVAVVLGAPVAVASAQEPPPPEEPPPAGPQTFRGETVQNRAVSVRTDAAGIPNRYRLEWVGTCRRDGFRYSTRTLAAGAFDTATVDRLRDTARFRERSRGRIVATIDTTTSAARQPAESGDRWTGTFRATIVVRRRGRTIDRCRTRTLRWSARADAS